MVDNNFTTSQIFWGEPCSQLPHLWMNSDLVVCYLIFDLVVAHSDVLTSSKVFVAHMSKLI